MVQGQTELLPTLSRLRLFLLTSHIFTIGLGLDFHTLVSESFGKIICNPLRLADETLTLPSEDTILDVLI